jgi:hypothetical protein
MITYITDQRAGEPDILTAIKSGELEIRCLAGTVLLKIEAPEQGWTHASLCAVQPVEAKEGADAWLSGQWIGSTEV